MVKEKDRIYESLERTIKEGMDNGVFFEPGIIDTASVFFKDSTEYKRVIDSLVKAKVRINTVEILPNGTIRATGNIKAATSKKTKETSEKKVAETENTKDSAAKGSAEVELKKEMKTVAKHVERKPGFQWWLLLIGAAIALVIQRYWKKILLIFKTFFMKVKLLALLFLAPMFLTGCYTYHDQPDKWIFSGENMIIPLGALIGMAASMAYAIRQTKKRNEQRIYPGEKYRFYHSSGFFVFLAFLMAFVWNVITTISDP
jgi:cation transport ATPase